MAEYLETSLPAQLSCVSSHPDSAHDTLQVAYDATGPAMDEARDGELCPNCAMVLLAQALAMRARARGIKRRTAESAMALALEQVFSADDEETRH